MVDFLKEVNCKLEKAFTSEDKDLIIADLISTINNKLKTYEPGYMFILAGEDGVALEANGGTTYEDMFDMLGGCGEALGGFIDSRTQDNPTEAKLSIMSFIRGLQESKAYECLKEEIMMLQGEKN